jgi:N-methylhydantoinase B
MAVLANRFQSIVREMEDTLLRTGRSTVINTARDFACTLITAESQLLATAEGLPVHVFGSQLQAESMTRLHPGLREGDAFLHNDPYEGASTHADHTVLVPIHLDGRHVFTASVKAHQADCGNSAPTTYMATARDVFEEGALVFPCVQVQRNFADIDDIIRMCRSRIRVPEQWHGDYRAMVGAARVAERRLRELADRYGVDTLERFAVEWLDYSERLMAEAIGRLPAGNFHGYGDHDAVPGLPDGIPVHVEVTIDPQGGHVEIDLRDNIDCVPTGHNQSLATSIANVTAAVFNSLHTEVPHNSGSFRRITVHLRENCVVGIPRRPMSSSLATTNVADRLINTTQSALATFADGFGLAEGAMGSPPACGVISGLDGRHSSPYVNQLLLGAQGGPASPYSDGWVTYGIPVTAGLMYRDSVEIDELRYPLLVAEQRILADTEGAGRYRGAPGSRVVYGPVDEPMTVIYPIDGHQSPPRGVQGGHDSTRTDALLMRPDGSEVALEKVAEVVLTQGERIVSISSGGGGYGSPLDRDPSAVLRDVEEKWVSCSRARDVYGVAIVENGPRLEVDALETARLRREAADVGLST